MNSSDYPYVTLEQRRFAEEEMGQRAQAAFLELDQRRSVRHFSPEPIPRKVLEDCIRTASTAPSGAHRQPWTFVVVTDPAIKSAIRTAAEAEEKESYEKRMNLEWLEALAPLGTNTDKPFLEVAPALIVVMRHAWGEDAGERVQNYYTQESVGIASGFLLAALHYAGLATLTHTPSPMGFLQKILGRPQWEKPYLLIPVGYPEPGCQVPDLKRKPLADVLVWKGE